VSIVRDRKGSRIICDRDGYTVSRNSFKCPKDHVPRELTSDYIKYRKLLSRVEHGEEIDEREIPKPEDAHDRVLAKK
jgi:hypothetical protein